MSPPAPPRRGVDAPLPAGQLRGRARRLRLAGWALALVPVLAIGWQLEEQLTDGVRSARWPVAEGVVERSEIVPRRIGPKTTADAEIVYRYEVGGIAYRNDRVTYAAELPAGWVAAGWSAEYPAGARVRVHYDPAAPQRSVLKPGLTLRGALVSALGAAGFAVFALGAAIVCFASARHWSRRADASDRAAQAAGTGGDRMAAPLQ